MRPGWRALAGLLALLLVAAGAVGCAREQAERRGAEAEATEAATGAKPATGTDGAAGATAEVSATGLPNAGAPANAEPVPQTYTVGAGDTLSGIAAQFGLGVNDLAQANGLADPNSLRVGQVLHIPATVADKGPAGTLVPDREFVYGPAHVGFDVGGFVAGQGGYLAQYSEPVDGELMSGAAIVELIAHEYSVSPRVLLAALEARGGWVSQAQPSGTALSYPLGYVRGGYDSLRRQLAWAADQMNRGYYDWRGRKAASLAWSDGTATALDGSLNAGTAGLYWWLAQGATKEQWLGRIGTGEGSFLAAYRQLFGEPPAGDEPSVPINTPLPALALPWARGEMWYYTSGPHGAWAEGSAWAAVDFVPDEGYLGCQVARSWATAAAPGLVVYSGRGQVLIDLDGDGKEQTGWVLFYLHLADEGRVPEGTQVATGDPLGHPSCEGGIGNASHLHFARRFNGEWIAADGPLPLILSGWQFGSTGTSYEGTATRDAEERFSCECMEPNYNGLKADR